MLFQVLQRPVVLAHFLLLSAPRAGSPVGAGLLLTRLSVCLCGGAVGYALQLAVLMMYGIVFY